MDPILSLPPTSRNVFELLRFLLAVSIFTFGVPVVI